jgi:hypothetical protein
LDGSVLAISAVPVSPVPAIAAAATIPAPSAAVAATTPAASAAPSKTSPAAATPAAPFRARTRFVHGEISAIEGLAVQRLSCFISFFLAGHRDESESPRATSHAVEHQIHIHHGPVLREKILQIVFRDVVGKVSYEQLGIHLGF